MRITFTYPLLISLLLGLSTYFYYFTSRLKKRFFQQTMDYLQFYFLFIAAPLTLILFFALFYNILKRPASYTLPFPDWLILGFAFIVSSLASMGVGMHTTGKCVSLHLDPKILPKAHSVNRFFHISLSHYLSYHGGLLLALILIVAEINHPEILAIPALVKIPLLLLGLIVGFSSSLAIIHVNFGLKSAWKVNLGFLLGLSLVLTAILISSSPNFIYLPLTIFFSCTIFSTFATVAFFYFLSKKEKSKLIRLLKTKLENIYPSLISYLPQKGK